jgi:hypothetical protein
MAVRRFFPSFKIFLYFEFFCSGEASPHWSPVIPSNAGSLPRAMNGSSGFHLVLSSPIVWVLQ